MIAGAAARAGRAAALPFSLFSIALIPVPVSSAATAAEAAAEAAKAVAPARARAGATAGRDAPCLADDNLIALFQAGKNLSKLPLLRPVVTSAGTSLPCFTSSRSPRLRGAPVVEGDVDEEV